MKHLALVLTLTLVVSGCTQPPPAAPAPAAAQQPGEAATPASTATASDVQPPIDSTPAPAPTEPLLQDDRGPARPTPSYFGPPAQPLPAGKVEDAPPAVALAGDGPRMLYFDQSLHVWDPVAERDEDLDWPTVAIDCPWLAPNGQTLYFADDEGVKYVDLAAAQPPELLMAHLTTDENPARHRRFCVLGQSDSGGLLLMQARDNRWYQWGVVNPETGVVRAVESPVGPRDEPWQCPGDAAWGQDNTLLVTGYSRGPCSQLPGLYKTEWGQPLVPSAVLTATLPRVEGRLDKLAGAWYLTRSPDGKTIAFWFDEDWADPAGSLAAQGLYTIAADGSGPQRIAGPLPGPSGPPAWSADSMAVYYPSVETFGVLDPRPWQIHRVDTTTQQDEVIAEFSARHVLLAGRERRGKLPLLTLDDELAYQLHLLDLATGELQNGPAQAAMLGWLGAE